jgi:transposase
MQHRNAPLTPNGRRRLVALVEEEGLTFEAAAAASNVSKSTAHTWVSRWRQAGEEQRQDLGCLQDRSSRPHRSPKMLSEAGHERCCEIRKRTGWGPRLVASELGIPHATVHRALRRRGCSRRPKEPREAVLRYEWPCPGNLLHMDTKRHARFVEPGHAVTGVRTERSRGAGWEFVHTLVDDCSRLAYSEIHDDERAATVTEFTRRGLDCSWRGGSSPSGCSQTTPGSTSRTRAWPSCWSTERSSTGAPSPTPADQWEGGAPAADDGPRVGSWGQLPLERRSKGGAATLARPLQREPSPLSSRQPPADGSRSGRLGARHLAHGRPRTRRARKGGAFGGASLVPRRLGRRRG